jgi:hypothetical protein
MKIPKPVSHFTPAAAKRWGQIPQEAQARILANVWCGNCARSVEISLETAEIEGKHLILKGKCKVCGKNVCRVVEPKNE